MFKSSSKMTDFNLKVKILVEVNQNIFYINKSKFGIKRNTVCPRSLDSFYTVSYYITWVKTSWIIVIYLHYLMVNVT